MFRSVIVLIAILCLAGCHGNLDSAQAKPQQAVPSPPLTLLDSEGIHRTPMVVGASKAVVLLFLMHDCPIANTSAPEISRLVADFTPRGVSFYGVYATETAAEISTHRSDYSLLFPGLRDGRGELARLAGATRVPEAAVFGSGGELLYRGRIDDRAVKLGVTKPVAHRHDLRLALESVLAGQPPDPRFTTALGCYLPDVKP